MPIVLAVNKIDSTCAEDNLNEYWELGLGEPLGISAEHGLGVGDLLDDVVAALPSAEDDRRSCPHQDGHRRPAERGQELVRRTRFSATSGPSCRPFRALLATPLTPTLIFEGTRMSLVDTAGLRRPGKRTTTDVEYYSSLRAIKAMERSDIALVVVDASEGLVDLDLQVAYEAQRAKCATASPVQ